MKPYLVTLTVALGATAASAEEMQIEGAYVPIAPPGVIAHAAYLALENTGDTTRSLIGVSANGYGMAHLHQSAESDGVATMSMIHQLDIAPRQTVKLQPGGFHIMLMRPNGPTAIGDTVPLTFTFANGAVINVDATIRHCDAGS